MDISYDMFIETEVPKDELIISRTDLNGIITYANETFARISGYTSEDLIGKPHSVLRHPDMPSRVFKELWETIKAGKTWSGYVKNLRKDRGFYWVYAEVSGVYKNGKLIEYKSMRGFVPKDKRIQMQKLYDKIRLEDKEKVREISYISFDVYYKIVTKAKQENIEPSKWLEKLIKSI
ncbi:PAS domain-containing protein [Nitrosophilus labii]|uniref:PAS domain-containing protein n=1 Tax=Nitrosophilus labii TaxID=2706014 RepID=UPI0016574840|nr:PAS domain-containing protein [Nitrosophilus labii]